MIPVQNLQLGWMLRVSTPHDICGVSCSSRHQTGFPTQSLTSPKNSVKPDLYAPGLPDDILCTLQQDLLLSLISTQYWNLFSADHLYSFPMNHMKDANTKKRPPSIWGHIESCGWEFDEQALPGTFHLSSFHKSASLDFGFSHPRCSPNWKQKKMSSNKWMWITIGCDT